MKQIAIGAAMVALFFPGLPVPLQAAPALIFEGKVTAADGKPVPAAEVRILDPAGQVQFHVFSDLQGQYRFPVLPSPAGTAYRMELSHLRYLPVEVADAVAGARIGTPTPADMAQINSAANAIALVITKDPLGLPSEFRDCITQIFKQGTKPGLLTNKQVTFNYTGSNQYLTQANAIGNVLFGGHTIDIGLPNQDPNHLGL